MNKKQCESYYEYKQELSKLYNLRDIHLLELQPQSHSVVDLTQTYLHTKEGPKKLYLANNLELIHKRIKQLDLLIQQVEDFIKGLPDQESRLFKDLYLLKMNRQAIAHKYHCDQRTVTRMADKIFEEYYPYNLSERTPYSVLI